jgi:CheY-like chemotaxis protein
MGSPFLRGRRTPGHGRPISPALTGRLIRAGSFLPGQSLPSPFFQHRPIGRAPPAERCTFPRRTRRHWTSVMDHSPPPPRGVLIVDADADTTTSLAALVRLWGHRAWVANCGQAALRLAFEHGPDVVILDLGLPDMMGWELASRLRRSPSLRGALMVVVSGFTRPDDYARSFEAGCDLYYLKPADPEQLRCLLAATYLERRVMTPEELAAYVRDLVRAAEVVEAIDDRDLQRQHGWNLGDWRYELVPWGVRFLRRDARADMAAEVLVLTGPHRSAPAAADTGRKLGARVVVSNGSSAG